ncbi:helix-turn-helix domain-containing protein [Sphingobacterium sp. 2149]|uniref:helix-turn-helix domain-containing protein n=1 Tax=Sphingobacterium sp. 2149 TaxID=2817763 RepID=UPI0028662959|nr:helix-turn-helix domain-containing protein [Sphingobacterium sp. 2149]MDR6733797.1 AraC-like DNA-binding protein [Sphingobacterium sp. 2149]
MIKTFDFILPKVAQFTRQVKAFSPKLPDSHLQRYEDANIQLIEEYIDYHSVIFYRVQAQVQRTFHLSVQTNKPDYHLLYNRHSVSTIKIEHAANNSHLQLPAGYDTYAYIPKGKMQTLLVQGEYLIYGVLVDIGYIRSAIFKEDHFLFKFSTAHLRDKKRLYQSAAWPIKEKTSYQLSRIEEHFFNYHKDNEAMAVKLIYDLFDIAIYKNFEHYEKIDPDQFLAERAKRMIRDQVTQTFSTCSIQVIADQLQIDISKLDKLYKTVYGETPRQTWNTLIIQKAKDLLLAGHSVKEVSNYCGYGSQQNFSAFFRKQTGICPSAYK